VTSQRRGGAGKCSTARATAAAVMAVSVAAPSAAESPVGTKPAKSSRSSDLGGGRHNPALMAELARRLGVPVEPVERAGWNGDALEAQAFAYLAVRSLAGLPLSLPGTTGVPAPMRGGVLHPAGVAGPGCGPG